MDKNLKFFNGKNLKNNLALEANSFYFDNQDYNLSITSNEAEINNLTAMNAMTKSEINDAYNKNLILKPLNFDSLYFNTDNILSLPEGITNLKAFSIRVAFWNSIKTLVLPSTLTIIKSSGIINLTKLQTLDCSKLLHIPTAQSSQFIDNCGDSFKIIVPAGQLADWKAATNWSVYADRMEEAE